MLPYQAPGILLSSQKEVIGTDEASFDSVLCVAQASKVLLQHVIAAKVTEVYSVFFHVTL